MSTTSYFPSAIANIVFPLSSYVAVKRKVGDTSEPLLERDLELHAGEIGTDAAMDTETECGVSVFPPVDHNLVRVGDEAGITIGGWKRKQDHLAGSVRAAPEDCVVPDLARHRHRRIGTQEFLDRGWDQGWLGH